MSRPAYPGDGLPEYANADEYDEENTWGPDDDFYLELAQEIGGPILDAGCGTGRLTRAMAAAGLDVTGLDITPAMLARARELSNGLDIEWIHGDASTMHLGRKFRLITMTSHAFQHLLTDQDIRAFFDRAREHLTDDGCLAFETRNFAAKTHPSSAEPTLWKSIQDTQGRWVDLLIGSQYDPLTEVEVLIGERFVGETGERHRETSSLRYVSVEHLNRMLNDHGFTIVHQYGDWNKGPLGKDKPEVISVCRVSPES